MQNGGSLQSLNRIFSANTLDKQTFPLHWSVTLSNYNKINLQFQSKFYFQTPQGVVPSAPKSTIQEASVAAREKFKLSQSEIIANLHAKEGSNQDEEQL